MLEEAYPDAIVKSLGGVYPDTEIITPSPRIRPIASTNTFTTLIGACSTTQNTPMSGISSSPAKTCIRTIRGRVRFPARSPS
jgi:hypothetical protein